MNIRSQAIRVVCGRGEMITCWAGAGTAHERKQRFARGQLPRLSVIRQRDVHAFT